MKGPRGLVVQASRGSSRVPRLGLILLALGVLLFVGLMSTIIVAIGIWPGEVKLVAPLFCTDAQPDAFVVADTYSPRPGETVTNFSLYCMGPRGDATDHGFFLPFLATAALNTTIIVLTVLGLWALRRLRRTRRREPSEIADAPPRGSTAGPFVT